jgi:putative spermidine/putrescine transport system permease protein
VTEYVLSPEEIVHSQAMLKRKKRILFCFVAPLLLFISISFVLPIGTMLSRSVYHPVVAELIPETILALESWDESTGNLPDESVVGIFTAELLVLANIRDSGKLAGDVNRLFPGASSLVKSTARNLKKSGINQLPQTFAALSAIKPTWNDPELWRAIKKSGRRFTDNFYLTALDLTRVDSGEIEARSTQIYIQLYAKSLKLALYITLLTILIGYPLAYYLVSIPPRIANVLMICVLLPFWTSLLVRTTSWIALLQTNGVINSVLQSLHIINEPLEMLYTQFATIIAMTHILLPFMVLPLYSVMKGIDPSYLRAALSLGGKPIPAFIKIYMPMTVPGLAAGSLLVFIISIGYYITPALVGGTDGQMISNIIAFHMQSSNNWELAAALGSLLLAVILFMYAIYDRIVGVSNIKLG